MEGFGRLPRALLNVKQKEWLQHNDNADRWMGKGSQKLTIKEERILIIQWVGNA